MKQDNHLYQNLSGCCNNKSVVDDKYMNWTPLSDNTTDKYRSKRFYSKNISPNILLSLQQDICHYVCLLGLEEGLSVDSATMNIRLQGSRNVSHNCFNNGEGYVAIFPYYFSNKSYSVSMAKVRYDYVKYCYGV